MSENGRLRLEALSGLRFAAAFCILLHHSIGWVAPFPRTDLIACVEGMVSLFGMPLFFVLSGFVIHYNYGASFARLRFRWAASEFLAARFARIYPLFICFFFVGACVGLHSSNPAYIRPLVLHYLSLTQSWFYMAPFGKEMLMSSPFGLAWSISTEFFFYVAYLGLVLLLLKLRSVRRALLAWAVFGFGALGFFVFLKFQVPAVEAWGSGHISNYISRMQNQDESFIRWLFYYSPYARIFEFVLGCLTAELYNKMPAGQTGERIARLEKWCLGFALATLAAMGCFYGFDIHAGGIDHMLGFLALNYGCAIPIAIVIWCAARSNTPVSRFLAMPKMAALGEISYSIYMIHTWTLRIFVRGELPHGFLLYTDALLRVALAVAFTIVFSTATYRLIEMPARRFLRDISSRILVAVFGARSANAAGPAGAWKSWAALGGLACLFGLCFIYQLSL